MYGRILVPVDGSETSTLGLNEAIMIAKAHGSELRLVNIVNEPVLEYNHSPGVHATHLIESLVKAGSMILDVAETAARLQGVRAERVMLESIGGPAADLILAQAQEWQADLIVMGTHGRRGLAQMAMGSDAKRVVRAASVPVLLVRVKPRGKNEAPERTLVEATAA